MGHTFPKKFNALRIMLSGYKYLSLYNTNLKMIYYVLVESLIQNSILARGGVYESYLKRLSTIQKYFNTNVF